MKEEITKSDKTLKKIELAEKLGMNSFTDNFKKKIKIKEEIANMTDMNFKQITEDEIEKMICKKIPHNCEELQNSDSLIAIILLSFLISVCSGIVSLVYACKPQPFTIPLLITLGSFGICLFNFIVPWKQKTVLKKIELKEWNDNIPYDALLAIKEAKEKGLNDFEIYYSVKDEVLKNYVTYRDSYKVKENPQIRYNTDPVIVGYSKNNIMFEVFTWDDKKACK